jgi:hypothetical protein
MKEDPHAVAAQFGHSLDVSLNGYPPSAIEVRREMVNRLEQLILKLGCCVESLRMSAS